MNSFSTIIGICFVFAIAVSAAVATASTCTSEQYESYMKPGEMCVILTAKGHISYNCRTLCKCPPQPGTENLVNKCRCPACTDPYA